MNHNKDLRISQGIDNMSMNLPITHSISTSSGPSWQGEWSFANKMSSNELRIAKSAYVTLSSLLVTNL